LTFVPLWISRGGVEKRLRLNADGSMDVAMTQDVTDILERNKAMATENDGFNKARDLRRVATIPEAVAAKWRDEGWYPHDKKKLAEKLNSAEWAWLRTAEGNLGVSNGVMR
jgi:hypothetical protein